MTSTFARDLPQHNNLEALVGTGEVTDHVLGHLLGLAVRVDGILRVCPNSAKVARRRGKKSMLT